MLKTFETIYDEIRTHGEPKNHITSLKTMVVQLGRLSEQSTAKNATGAAGDLMIAVLDYAWREGVQLSAILPKEDEVARMNTNHLVTHIGHLFQADNDKDRDQALAGLLSCLFFRLRNRLHSDPLTVLNVCWGSTLAVIQAEDMECEAEDVSSITSMSGEDMLAEDHGEGAARSTNDPEADWLPDAMEQGMKMTNPEHFEPRPMKED